MDIMKNSTSVAPALLAPLALTLLLGGCITMKPASQKPSEQAMVIPGVPLETWGDQTCGAAALSTVLRLYGDEVAEEDLVPLLPKGRNGGVVSVDLLLAARQRGYGAKLLRGSEDLVREAVESSQPPIIMIQVVDLPGSSRDLFHYLVIDGFDPARNNFRAQFGDGRARWISLQSLDKQWAATDYATLLVDSTATGTRGSTGSVARGVLLEEEGRLEEAADLYRAVIRTDPGSALAWTNLGNVQLKLGDPSAAEESYREALTLSPGDRDVLNNLAWLLWSEGRDIDEAEILARRAAIAPGDDAFLYQDTLARILHAQGKCEEAIELLRQALFGIPGAYEQYRASILFGLGRAQLDCGQAGDGEQTLQRALDARPDEHLRAEIEMAIANGSR
jgi:tetratricopeptide (TPR) repeat protein